jgi:hypothetical protein
VSEVGAGPRRTVAGGFSVLAVERNEETSRTFDSFEFMLAAFFETET